MKVLCQTFAQFSERNSHKLLLVLLSIATFFSAKSDWWTHKNVLILQDLFDSTRF